jgi:hypothetical protein
MRPRNSEHAPPKRSYGEYMQMRINCKFYVVFFQTFARLSAAITSNFAAIIGQNASNSQNSKIAHEKMSVPAS